METLNQYLKANMIKLILVIILAYFAFTNIGAIDKFFSDEDLDLNKAKEGIESIKDSAIKFKEDTEQTITDIQTATQEIKEAKQAIDKVLE